MLVLALYRLMLRSELFYLEGKGTYSTFFGDLFKDGQCSCVKPTN